MLDMQACMQRYLGWFSRVAFAAVGDTVKLFVLGAPTRGRLVELWVEARVELHSRTGSFGMDGLVSTTLACGWESKRQLQGRVSNYGGAWGAFE